uniref:Ovule protein n=1 Tax=Echinococcus canadensis TaxID=519352 RepID=A0A915F0C8_9CEST
MNITFTYWVTRINASENSCFLLLHVSQWRTVKLFREYNCFMLFSVDMFLDFSHYGIKSTLLGAHTSLNTLLCLISPDLLFPKPTD